MVVMSWLTAFNIINRHNNFVSQVSYALYRLTEPVLGPIRRILPDLGGLDFSPVVALILLQFIRYLVIYYGVRLLQ
jgi:YggT family protein